MVLPELDLAKGEHLYLLLDGAQIPDLERQLFDVTDKPAYQPLYLYAPWDSLREVSPCLVEANSQLLTWFQALPTNAGWLLASPLPLMPLADRLRQLIEVESPYGSRILLKLAAPETMACLMVDPEPWLWQGVAQVWLPTRDGWQHWLAKVDLATPLGEKCKLTDPQWARLGEVSWQNQLESTYRHMEQWFPVRLAEQSDPGAWIAHWAKQAYQLGFQTERDVLLFFNVLGFLGESWWKGDAYPVVTKLLTTASAQTPSQRVEQAANWAEQHVNAQERSS
ncbi:DUF4123 domain-containing protein [Aeromonas enteropelogenes]|uniref:DUF4123 domain-containing protein n=1 Tax=Aeromonas enteropelogenes TaxID=29489 RepID=UPI00191D1366|nr:DUF4123 domain-containing protein [Aeromonas enteropelogenes]MBL0521218.1 DUF4123 domain-containing protein [Aeromonas enteropelogenes]